MIPIKLALRNFMCYRDNVPPLSFEGIHLACLCGDNGAGKSALLDAMTWALWGEARGRGDDELVHLGETEMEVELEFAVDTGRYRVIRKRSRPGLHRQGRTILELQVAGDGSFRPITGASVGHTQQLVQRLLRLDYETFVNSAFLRQGHADEFTRKRPGERKQVLADILNLTRYDELEERARRRAREADARASELDRAVAEMDRELAARNQHQAELSGVTRSLVTIEEDIQRQDRELAALRQARQELELKREQQSAVEQSLRQARQELERLERELVVHRQRLADYEVVLARRDQITRGYAEFLQARQQKDDMDERLQQSHTLNQERARLEKTIEAARNELVVELRLLQSRASQAEAGATSAPRLEAELVQAQAEAQALMVREQTLEARRHQWLEMQGQAHQLKAATSTLTAEMAEVEEKLALLSRGEGRCPLCGAELGMASRQHIEDEYGAQRRQRQDALTDTQARLEQIGQQAANLETEIAGLRKSLGQEQAAAQGRLATLAQELAQATQAAASLVAARQSLDKVRHRLEQGDFVPREREQLAELAERLARLGYDAEAHRRARERLSELQDYEGQYRRLAEAEKLVAVEQRALDSATQTAARWHSSQQADQQRYQALALELVSLPQVKVDLEKAEREYRALQERRSQGQRNLGAIQQRLERLAQLEQLRQQKAAEMTRAAEDKGIYEELSLAFGKKGVQALIIESVLPEIEAEANRLLSRMTDGRMHVKLETQRQYKTRRDDPMETLDIYISDELGTRDYELYSGGEAFRINLALRIALSRLLTRRAGAPLSTLIIDEGFGTQDTAGRDKLVEAINSIQDDFDKILVITHIEALKDAFPVRIEVTKTEQGSTIAVN
ncbi:MAG: SMC family ATPase [Chloroflexi bacterium]|nr:SMC family ATPase [Chloroflexota bacterium]